MLIGRMGGMKSVAVDFEEIMMEPVHMADVTSDYCPERQQRRT